jgi:hypothetical protein
VSAPGPAGAGPAGGSHQNCPTALMAWAISRSMVRRLMSSRLS